MLWLYSLIFLQLSLSTCDITVLLNFSIPLTCLPDNVPVLADSTYTWSFTSAHTQQQHTLEEKGNILNLRNIKTTQEGQYKCFRGYKGEEHVRLRRTFTIRVKVPPPFQEWQVVRVVAGNVVMLLCKVAKFFSSRETEKHPVFWKRETEKGDMLLMPNKDTDDQEEKKKNMFKIKSFLLVYMYINCIFKSQITCFLKESLIFQGKTYYLAPPPPSCFGHTDPWEACGDQDRRSGKANLQDSLREFFTSVYADLKGSKPTSSPQSAATAVAFYNLLLGARGETRTQLEDALRLPSEFFCVHFETLKQVIKDTLGMASTIFIPQQQLRESFVNQSLEFYDALSEKLTYDSNQNMELINQVAQKTNKKITKLIDSVDPATSFVLLNAVYFNGKWKTVFEFSNKQENFMKFSGEVMVPTLYSSKYNFKMGYNKKLQAEVGKFCLTGKNSLYILIPRTTSEESFVLMENNINRESIESMVSEINTIPAQTAEVRLPKIKLIVDTPLEGLLRNLGLSDLFLKPNLCRIFPGDSESFISDICHSAFLSLTEQGVEAAAATRISFSAAPQPFVLILWNDELAPLFMGRIINP
uniref:Complement system-related protein C1INH-2 n=1 Tax=Cyprinus carpio TaxID=7962 RepID=A0A5Q2UB76_CYPCA|nr:complement system-related protein C1INH-2 [Cyprinus carpio]